MRAEWASSALDRRHRLTLTPIYDFKPFQSGSWLLKNVVGNWNISGTYTFQSPEYATVQSGVDSNLNNDTAGDRAIVNPAGAANTSSGVNPINAAGQVVAAGFAFHRGLRRQEPQRPVHPGRRRGLRQRRPQHPAARPHQ